MLALRRAATTTSAGATAAASAKAGPRFAKRGQLLPRERLGLLLDAGAPFLAALGAARVSCSTSPIRPSRRRAAAASPASAAISGTRCMVVVDDSGIEAGALQPMGLEKFQRAQQIALENRLPFVHLVESAGANLLRYRVEDFINGGSHYARLAPPLGGGPARAHASCTAVATAGGAYMPGPVRLRRHGARPGARLPRRPAAAEGRHRRDRHRGGSRRRADARDGLRPRGVPRRGRRRRHPHPARATSRGSAGSASRSRCPSGTEPRYPADDLLGLMPRDGRKPVDMREVIARLVDGSDFLEFKAGYGPATVCVHASIAGLPVGILTNNGPLDPAGSTKATHFIQACCQSGIPLVYLQNTTGYIVGHRVRARRHDQARLEDDPGGGQRHGAAGDRPVRRIVRRRQLRHVRPRLRAALPVRLAERAHRRDGRRAGRGHHGDRHGRIGARARPRARHAPRSRACARRSIETFERQTSAFYTSGRLLDDGVIDPRDTRRVLALRPHPLPPRRAGAAAPARASASRDPEPETADHAVHPRTRRTEAHRRAILRAGNQPARRRMGGGRHLPGPRGVQEARRPRPARPHQARGIRRRRARLQLLGRDGRGARQLRAAAACRWRSACRPTWRRPPSPASAPTSCAASSSRPRLPATWSPASASRSRPQAPTSPRSARRHARTAATT